MCRDVHRNRPHMRHQVPERKPRSPSFDWTQQEEIPYRPWYNGPYHITMGLKRMDVEDWIEIDKTYMERYRLKKDLFENHREDVMQIQDGVEDAAFEALELLINVLPKRYPTMFKKIDGTTIQNLVTGDTWDTARGASTWEKYHPMQVMSLLATEDFFIMHTDDEGRSSLKAGVVCFPAGWKIKERIGHSLWQIHAGKVPQYESKLAKSMDRFFQNMRVDGSIQRFNFAIDDSNELFHPHSHHNLTADQVGKDPALEDLHLRVERQALQRLPNSRSLLFSIRTYVTPITKVTMDREVAEALRTSVESYSPDVAKYKNKPLWERVVAAHLQEVLEDDLPGS
ncbi:hypothetical protein K491DRAFT_709108 [Lophiostoma macrostomum CBS 122681]|uniref:DUF3445 domain-containing protein n=1 Tax=Lophiostoma macrostomum CBS 122681 TaxID=1314788 RepID=A0A6A6SL48_9PLEO|nr:hypothetical protein K491DRAFT_709108 [Lophiostoma macrostomum CBS 122681]